MLTLLAAEQPSLQSLDLWIIGLYLVALLGMGLILERLVNNSADMFAAGGKSPWWLSGVSAYMTMFSSGTFVVWGGIAYKAGMVAVSISTMLGFSALLVAFFLASRWKATGATSAAEYIGLRYGQSAVQLYTWLGIITRMIGAGVALYSIAVILCALIPIPETANTGAFLKFLSDGSHLSVPLTIIAVGVIVVIISGNLWAVLITDTLQFIVLAVAVIMVLPLLFGDELIGGISGFIEHAKAQPALFDQAVDGENIMVADEGKTLMSLSSGPFTWLFLTGWIVIHMFKVGGEWAFVQRFLSVPKKSDAVKVSLVFGGLYLISPLIWMLPPIIYRILNPVAAGDDAAMVNGVAEKAYILACQYALPAGMVGLVIAAMFSATVSMVDSEINVYAGALTRDVYAKLFNKQEGHEKHLVIVGKLLTLVLGGTVVGIALLIDNFGKGWAEKTILTITGLFVAPLVLPTIWALFSKRVGLSAVFITVLVGAAVSALVKFVFDDAEIIKNNPRDVEVIVGIVPPVLTLLALEFFSKGVNKNVARTEALRDHAELADAKVSATMPRKVIAWSCVGLGLVMIALAILGGEHRIYLLTGAGALLAIGGAMLLPDLVGSPPQHKPSATDEAGPVE